MGNNAEYKYICNIFVLIVVRIITFNQKDVFNDSFILFRALIDTDYLCWTDYNRVRDLEEPGHKSYQLVITAMLLMLKKDMHKKTETIQAIHE